MTGDGLNIPALAPGEEVIAAVVMEDAASLEESAPQDSGIVLVTDQQLVWRGGGASAPQASPLPPGGVTGAAAGDFDTDGRMELLLLTDGGIRILKRGAAGWSELWANRGLADSGALLDAVPVDYDHDGDLDIIGLARSGEAVVFLNRGDAGIDNPAPMPIDGGGHFSRVTAFDVDGDADLDLVLAGDGDLAVLANDRQGRFSRRDNLDLDGAPTRIIAGDYRGDGHTGVIVLTPSGLHFFRGTADGTLAVDELADASAADVGGVLEVHDVGAADLDLDGDQDLILVGEAAPQGATLVGLENGGGGYFRMESRLAEPSDTAWDGVLLADLDADKDPDVLTWSAAGAPVALMAQGAEEQGWFGLQLRAPRGKVPLDAKGAQVEVYAGGRYEKLLPEHPNLVVGVGSATPDLVRITWPNGISQYLFEPEVGGEYVVVTLELKVEGSCPFLYARDGEDMRFVTDVLGLAPLGLQVAPGIYAKPDEEEYVRLPDWVQPVDGALDLVLTEELREVLYLDQVELVAVDAPQGVEVFNHERWYPGPVEGLGLEFLGPLETPVAVTDFRGRDALGIIEAEDQRYLTNFPGKGRYQGTVATHSLIIELPESRARRDHLGLLMVGWLHWSNTSNNIARGQDPGGQFLFPTLEVPAGDGGWREVAKDVGVPAGKTKPIVVDLGGLLNPADPRVRITTNMEVYWDRIAFGTILDAAAVEHEVRRLAPATADLAFRGFARWYRPAPNGPYEFDYGELRPFPWRVDATGREFPIAWDELAGNYTAFGPVGDLVTTKDDQLTVFGSGEHLSLRFDAASLDPPAAGKSASNTRAASDN
ncbi:MAG: FG-GAP repeat domain-containing protein, partial [Anaerolineae bacterium]